MSAIGLAPIRMREATLAIEADDYTTSINQVIFTPQADVAWERPLATEDFAPYVLGVKWSVALGFAQDLTTPGSLSTYLIEHAGQQKVVTFEIPGRVIAAAVLILPAQFGGVANQIPAAVVTMPLYGQPNITGV